MIVDGGVYDVSKYAPYHPGGYYELARAVGENGSDLYNEIHPWVKVSSMLATGRIVIVQYSSNLLNRKCYEWTTYFNV